MRKSFIKRWPLPPVGVLWKLIFFVAIFWGIYINYNKKNRGMKSRWPLAHRCAIFLCYLGCEIHIIDDQHRNPNMNNKAHLARLEAHWEAARENTFDHIVWKLMIVKLMILTIMMKVQILRWDPIKLLVRVTFEIWFPLR